MGLSNVETNETPVEMEVSSDSKVITFSIDQRSASSESYNSLLDKPTLNGKTIVGDMWETDPTVPDWSKASTKPTYTANEVGAIGEESVMSIAELAALF